MRFSGTSALVTGAASGLGAATAAAFAEAGAQGIGIDLPAAVERAGATSGIRLAAADVTDEQQVSAALDLVDLAAPLRVVVNCAGIAPQRRILGSKGVHDLDTFRRALEVNLVGTFNMLRLAAERMAATDPDESGGRGVIINTASVAGYEGQIGQAAYAASKGGVIALTITAARDLASRGIRANTIAPGLMDTPMLQGLGEQVSKELAATIPFPQRLARPDEYAELALMIAGHDYLNGETIRLDGALRMGPR